MSEVLLSQIAAILQKGTSTQELQSILELVTKHFGCCLGTVHLLKDDQKTLYLAAQLGVPPPVIEKIKLVPVGKGMAGVAGERKEPVQVCNLQTDASGVVRPGAKETRMEGAIAVPMLVGGVVLGGVLGIAKSVPYDFQPHEADLLLKIGGVIAQSLTRLTRQEIIDLYFIEIRAKLIDLAAFLDRVDRASGPEDFRIVAFRSAMQELLREKPERARKILESLSDPTRDPIEKAVGKSACGAWDTTNPSSSKP